jgi:hypothetical protein
VGGGALPDEASMKRSDEFRKAATECLALAQKTTDAGTRLSLLTMAEKLFELANAPSLERHFEAAVRDFNHRQMFQR